MTTTVDMAPSAETKYNHCLNFYEQMDIIAKARLSLSLKAPDDEMTLEQKNELYEEQRIQILNFVELLHQSLICENGKVLLCLFHCE